jgi:hypothetical protein
MAAVRQSCRLGRRRASRLATGDAAHAISSPHVLPLFRRFFTLARIKPADRKRAALSTKAAAQPIPSTAAADAIADTPVAAVDSGSPLLAPAPPTPRVAQLVSAAIMLHGLLILLSYLAVVRPSEIQARILNSFAPYLATLHFNAESDAADVGTAEGVSFFLARGEASERSHRLQFKTTVDRSDDGWVTAEHSGAAGSGRLRRHQRFLTAVASLGESEQNALVARLVYPLIQSRPDVQMVRVIRLPNTMTNPIQDSDSTPYTAAIVREQDAVRLVRVPPPRLSSAASGTAQQP